MAMRCPQCGSDYPDGMMICRRCERRLEPVVWRPDRLTWLAAGLFLTGMACVMALAVGRHFHVEMPAGLLFVLGTFVLVAGLALYHFRGDVTGMRDTSAKQLAVLGWAALIAGFFLQLPDAMFYPFDTRRQTCMEHQYRLSVAMLMYCQDHDTFPANLGLDLGYGVTADDLACPEGGGYGYNHFLPGRRYLEVANPAGVLLTADSQSTRPLLTTPDQLARDRHRQENRRGFCAAYADGHTAFLPQDAEVRLEVQTRVPLRGERGVIVVPRDGRGNVWQAE